jgi:hypothetical protein
MDPHPTGVDPTFLLAMTVNDEKYPLSKDFL